MVSLLKIAVVFCDAQKTVIFLQINGSGSKTVTPTSFSIWVHKVQLIWITMGWGIKWDSGFMDLSRGLKGRNMGVPSLLTFMSFHKDHYMAWSYMLGETPGGFKAEVNSGSLRLENAVVWWWTGMLVNEPGPTINGAQQLNLPSMGPIPDDCLLWRCWIEWRQIHSTDAVTQAGLPRSSSVCTCESQGGIPIGKELVF